MDATKLLHRAGVIPVVVIDDPGLAVPLAETLLEAGFGAIEITLRTAAALESIENIVRKFPEAIVGAGSIRNVDQFEEIRNAGAQFAVSPGSSDKLLGAAAKAKLPFIPGAVTASEAIYLQEQGYTLVKFFPAELSGGIEMLRALGGPLPEIQFFPTGGISLELAGDYLALANVSCVGGSWMLPQNLLAAADFKAIAKLAREAALIVPN